ncbi:MAG: hypothetical protein ACRCT8_14285 [Lacipirellulaceae bacterium]
MQIVSVQCGVPIAAVLAERSRRGDVRIVVRGEASAAVAAASDPAAAASALRAALPGLRRGAEFLIALGGDALRSRRIAVPPVPADELPELVRLQVERDAQSGVVIDYSPIAGDSGQPSALACWCDAAVIDHWRAVAAQLGGRLVTVTSRAIVAAQTIAAQTTTDRTCLAVARAGADLDFVLLEDGAPLVVRSARAGDSDPAAAVLLELRRTLLAIDGVPRNGAAESSVLTVAHDGGLDAIDSSATGPAATGPAATGPAAIDGVRFARARQATESVAATLAMGHAVGDRPTIDLARPRAAKKKTRDWRLQGLVAAAAASALLAGAWGAYARVAALDAKIAAAEARTAEAKRGAEEFRPYREQVETIDRWLATDVTWLDELERLVTRLRPNDVQSKDFPRETDAKLVQLVATARVEGDEPGGTVALQAASASASMAALEARLRDASHPVEPLSTAETSAADSYRYLYRAAIRVPPFDPFADRPAEPQGAPTP